MHCRGGYRISKRGTRLLLTTKKLVHVCDVYFPLYEVWGPPKGVGVPDPQVTPPPPPGSTPALFGGASLGQLQVESWCRLVHVVTLSQAQVSCLALSWPVSQSATGPHWPPTPDTQCMTPPAPGTIGPGVEVLC